MWRKLKTVSYWYLLVGFFVIGGLFIYTNRANNLEMIRLRANVFLVDEANGDVEQSLRDLRTHIYAHMNTSLADNSTSIYPPIQLKSTYERLVAAERTRVAAVNEKTYTDAQIVCERQFPVGLANSGRIPCIEDYVSQRGVQEQPIAKELYQFDFVSPAWSPDLAGWSLVLTFIFGVAFLVRLAMALWARAYSARRS